MELKILNAILEKKTKNMRMGDKEEPTQISEWADEQKHANISTL